MLRYQWEDAARFWNSKKGADRERVGTTSRQKQKFTHKLEKLKDEWAEYEAIASNDSPVNLDNIDNKIISKVLGPERYGQAQAEVQRLRDQMAQMQVSTVEQIAQLKVEAALRKAKAQRKYDEIQLQLKAEVAVREADASRKFDELQLQLQNMMKMFQHQ
ncbi:Testis-specific gene 10 protein [Gossypium arboreum]|uniref:Testis-specific gene 10 protein n=1 Tax=Gossypium arboreum TaxID=29729 RepID=A0A0B0PF79_GOSAR|nr:Testis-specific gene 10 protein [Gossypium arboreum]